ncbi:MAG: response regulator [bacterium]|nr:response regulator [bacterium]
MMEQMVLIVDDIPDNVELLMEMLTPDYLIKTAVNGYEALEIARSDNPPDLIILDVMMPGLGGYEVCKQLKSDKKTKHIPVIFITAMNEEQDETRGFDSGAVDYIKKPFSMPIIQSRIRTHLKIKNQRKRIEEHSWQLKETLKALDIRNRFFRQLFGRYLSDDIVDTILETPEGICMGGEKREVTLMMSDLRNFTAMGEKLPAEEVMGIVNTYLEVMTDIIFKYHGTIDEFIGDAILAIFGAPVPQEDHARQAVACSLEMQLAMTEVNRRCRENGYPEVQQGIAINTGPVVIGNIGSARRSKYGVVGRHVNLTGRIESYTSGGQIFISERTKDHCGEILRIDDQVEIRPKGISTPINIYEPGGIGGDFNIFRPEKKKIYLQQLDMPMDIRFKILMEDRILDTVYSGKLVALDEMSAEFQTQREFRKSTNLEVSLLDEKGNNIASDLVVRVIGSSRETGYICHVTFVSVPSKVRNVFSQLKTIPSPETS